MSQTILDVLESVLPPSDTAVVRDLKLNLKRWFSEGALADDEKLFALVATAKASRHVGLLGLAVESLKMGGADPAQIAEAEESAAIMAMLNTYYRFKYMVGKDEDYRVVGLRMMSLSKPVLGKERFEMLAFAVSVINGCETCVRAHEKVLRDAGVSADKVHDLARLAGIVKGLAVLSA